MNSCYLYWYYNIEDKVTEFWLAFLFIEVGNITWVHVIPMKYIGLGMTKYLCPSAITPLFEIVVYIPRTEYRNAGVFQPKRNIFGKALWGAQGANARKIVDCGAAIYNFWLVSDYSSVQSGFPSPHPRTQAVAFCSVSTEHGCNYPILIYRAWKGMAQIGYYTIIFENTSLPYYGPANI
jgi:hypothetical protein